jgi:non-ribosomal peptide synthase protein (TIGR01720 family)
VRVEVPEETTRTLLREAPAHARAEIDDLLLAALAVAVGSWAGGAVLVDVEGHGREPLFEDLDPSSVVGWLTSSYPLVLDEADGAAAALAAVKARRRSIPDHGVGYGILRYLGSERAAAALAGHARAELSFNYLGQLDRGLERSAPFASRAATETPQRSPHGVRRHLLSVEAHVTAGRLRLDWVYSVRRYARETVERLAGEYAAALQSVVAAACSGEAGAAREDFPLAALDEAMLTRLTHLIGGSRS